jgi:predicted Fe-S protein YdhL (DUF1289 family)
MIRFNLVVCNPDPNGDIVQKTLCWHALPGKGHTLNIAAEGCTGCFAVVDEVQHWLGLDEIDVKCHITDRSAAESFEELKKDGFRYPV